MLSQVLAATLLLATGNLVQANSTFFNQSISTASGVPSIQAIVGGCKGSYYLSQCVAGNTLEMYGNFLDSVASVQIGRYDCAIVARPVFGINCKMPSVSSSDLGKSLPIYLTSDKQYGTGYSANYACPSCPSSTGGSFWPDDDDNDYTSGLAIFGWVMLSMIILAIVICIIMCITKCHDRNTNPYAGMHVERQRGSGSIPLIMPVIQPMMQPMMQPMQQHAQPNYPNQYAPPHPSDQHVAPPSYQPAHQPSAPYNIASEPTKVIDISDPVTFRQLLNSAKSNKQLCVVDYYATWCPPCQQIGPEMDKLSMSQTNVMFLKVDVDRHQMLASGAEIESMPTFVFWVNSQIVDRVNGADLQSVIAKCEQWSKTANRIRP